MKHLIKEIIKEKVLEYIRQKYVGMKTYNGTIVKITDNSDVHPWYTDGLEVYFKGERNIFSGLFAYDICKEIKSYYGINLVRYHQLDSEKTSEWL